jgi:hypothetical protein
MNIATADLDNLTSDWHHWPAWHQQAIVRRAGHRWLAVTPNRIYKWTIIAGPITRPGAYDNLWTYHSPRAALVAANQWTGIGEPAGWAAHPLSRRQRVGVNAGYLDIDDRDRTP